jgi:hypothetical protein
MKNEELGMKNEESQGSERKIGEVSGSVWGW